jgi:hypothetical protein
MIKFPTGAPGNANDVFKFAIPLLLVYPDARHLTLLSTERSETLIPSIALPPNVTVTLAGYNFGKSAGFAGKREQPTNTPTKNNKIDNGIIKLYLFIKLFFLLIEVTIQACDYTEAGMGGRLRP